MAIDLKYGRVTLEHPGDMGEDEYVFIIRARDATAPSAIIAYIKLSLMTGARRFHIDAALSSLEAIKTWQAKHPDLIRKPASRHFQQRTEVE